MGVIPALFSAVHIAGISSSDFGTVDDPGNNVLACSGGGPAVAQSVSGALSLAGNAWDRAVPRVASRPAEAAEVRTTVGGAVDLRGSRTAGIACARR